MTKLADDIPHELLRQLAAATILQAIKDAKGKDIVQNMDALMWLGSRDIGLWLEWAGMPFADPFQMLVSRRAEKVKRRGRYKAA